jgi:hypothetical protein
MGAMVPPSRKSCYNFRVISIDRVLDGDTIDVTIDLGFDLYKKERVRVAGVDTPEKRTKDAEEKNLDMTQPTGSKKNSKALLTVMTSLLFALSLWAVLASMVAYSDGYTSGMQSCPSMSK